MMPQFRFHRSQNITLKGKVPLPVFYAAEIANVKRKQHENIKRAADLVSDHYRE